MTASGKTLWYTAGNLLADTGHAVSMGYNGVTIMLGTGLMITVDTVICDGMIDMQ